jgi:glycosyltransferase involved in cell wall biosynthesis
MHGSTDHRRNSHGSVSETLMKEGQDSVVRKSREPDSVSVASLAYTTEPVGPSIAVIVLAYNEGRNIGRLLQNVGDWSQRTFVVDSFSTDDTAAVAESMGATVEQHRLVNHAQQFQWAIENLPFATEWVIRLDADELLSDELMDEIRRRLPEMPEDVTGINLKRRRIFLGRWIKHGGPFPLTLLRIWRRGAAKIEQRWIDEHMVLLRGSAVTFNHDFLDYNLSDLYLFTEEHNKYATRAAIDVLLKRYNPAAIDEALSNTDAPRQAAQKRRTKEIVRNQLPFWLGPLGYFLYRYFVQLGFLDGTEGLVYHFLQGFWYRLLVAVKVDEFDRILKPLPDRKMRLEALTKLTGYRLSDFDDASEPR